MTRRLFALAGLVVALAGQTSLGAMPRSDQASPLSAHVAWVENVMRRMATIKPGMTRADLLTVFTTEGGAWSREKLTFVSRDCPYFKVDVTFDLVGPPNIEPAHCIPGVSAKTPCDPSVTVFMVSDKDRIVTISRPYLQFTILD